MNYSKLVIIIDLGLENECIKIGLCYTMCHINISNNGTHEIFSVSTTDLLNFFETKYSQVIRKPSPS